MFKKNKLVTGTEEQTDKHSRMADRNSATSIGTVDVSGISTSIKAITFRTEWESRIQFYGYLKKKTKNKKPCFKREDITRVKLKLWKNICPANAKHRGNRTAI